MIYTKPGIVTVLQYKVSCTIGKYTKPGKWLYPVGKCIYQARKVSGHVLKVYIPSQESERSCIEVYIPSQESERSCIEVYIPSQESERSPIESVYTKPGKWAVKPLKVYIPTRKVTVKPGSVLYQARKVTVPCQESDYTKPGKWRSSRKVYIYQARKVTVMYWKCIYQARKVTVKPGKWYTKPGKWRSSHWSVYIPSQESDCTKQGVYTKPGNDYTTFQESDIYQARKVTVPCHWKWYTKPGKWAVK